MKISDVAIGRVRPYESNPRVNDKAVDGVARSIQEFGWRQAIVVDADYVIIAGHTRYKAAQKLGLSKVPVHVATDLTPEQVRAYRLADNKLGEIAEWNLDLLAVELAELKDFDFAGLGFSESELESLLPRPDGLTDPDAVPPVPSKPKSKRGDLYILGDHRLLCGDSTKPEDVARLMNGEKAVLMNTDPPYGIDYTDEARVLADRAHVRPEREQKWANGIENDGVNSENLQAFLEAAIRSAVPHLTETCAFYLWHPMLTQGTFFAAAAAAAAAADILVHRQIIWVKPSLLFGFGDYHWRHELCFYGWVKGNRPPFYGERNQTTVWEITHEVSNGGREHPTQKPVELFIRPMHNHTKSGEVCYDPFAGSGSQIIAAEQLGRKCYGMEIEPKYVDVCVKRWEEFTGLKAKRIRS